MSGVELVLQGNLASNGAIPWIAHRARLLDLKGWVERVCDTRIRIVLSGPDPLIDAMEAACSLGPCDVIVDDVLRQELALSEQPQGFVVA